MRATMGIAVFAALLTACTNLTFSPSDEDSTLVTVPSSSLSVERHANVEIAAKYMFRAVSAPATDATWTSSDPGVAAIDGNGEGDHISVLAVAPGTTTITVKADLDETSIDIVVLTPHAVALLVSPPQPQVTVGSTVAMIATATMSDGEALDVTSAADWSSSASSIATIDPGTGTVHGIAKGNSNITAQFQSQYSSTRVTVK